MIIQHISGLVQVIAKIKLLITSRYFLGSAGFESIQSIFCSGEVDIRLQFAILDLSYVLSTCVIHFFLVGLSSDCTIVQAEAFSIGFWFKTFIRKYASNYSFKSRFSVAKSVSERMLHKDIQEC